MSDQKPTIVLVHGAFAESASWNGVIARLRERGVRTVAAANPLRSLSGDAAYVRDVIAAVGGPVILVGHSYGGMVITQASADNDAVVGLVYVAAFVPDTGESAFALSTSAPGSTLGDALDAYPVATGGNEFAIRQELFVHQFAADVPPDEAATMAATQRPVTEEALSEPLPAANPGWKSIPSWHVFGDADLTSRSRCTVPAPSARRPGAHTRSPAPRTRSRSRSPTRWPRPSPRPPRRTSPRSPSPDTRSQTPSPLGDSRPGRRRWVAFRALTG